MQGPSFSPVACPQGDLLCVLSSSRPQLAQAVPVLTGSLLSLSHDFNQEASRT